MKRLVRCLTASGTGLGRRACRVLLGSAVALCVTVPSAGADAAGQAADVRVGHTVRHIVVPGSAAGEDREVDVHLWYPADQQGLSDRPKTVYRSALWHDSLEPTGFTPLSWEVEAEIAREDAPIDPHGQAFPVIVFSHGSTNDPIDYAHTLELIAGAGFVVAAPYHVNNTQDDARIDYINEAAKAVPNWKPIPCNDHRPAAVLQRPWRPVQRERPGQGHQAHPRHPARLVGRPRRRVARGGSRPLARDRHRTSRRRRQRLLEGCAQLREAHA